MEDETSLLDGEPHPMAFKAKEFLMLLGTHKLLIAQDILGASNTRQSKILYSTLNRLLNGRPVSDRYLLGLFTWFLFAEQIITLGDKYE